jgi:hypothetical protein
MQEPCLFTLVCRGVLPQGYVIRPDDVGKIIDYTFGKVIPQDVGKSLRIDNFQIILEDRSEEC